MKLREFLEGLENYDKIVVKLKNLDENQEDTLNEALDETIEGNEDLFVRESGNIGSIIEDIKTSEPKQIGEESYINATLTIRVQKGKVQEAKKVIKKKLGKVLNRFSIAPTNLKDLLFGNWEESTEGLIYTIPEFVIRKIYRTKVKTEAKTIFE